MASRSACTPWSWKNFHSHIAKDGTRYRYQVRQNRKTKAWSVQCEVWPDGERHYYTAPIPVPDRHGKVFWEMQKTWSNVDEDKNPPLPAGYESGFKGLTE